MFSDKTFEPILAFFNEVFKGMFNAWNIDSGERTVSVYEEWQPLCSWMIFFVIFAVIVVYLLCKSRIIEHLSRHILSLSFWVWLFGVLVYIVGFYNGNVNGLSVVLRAIVSSFKMFVVSNDLARISATLQTDPSYMTAFSLLHFAAAFITFLFIFKMLGFKIRSSMKVIYHKWFKAKGSVVHLFWGVNEASCLLAEDIRRRNSRDTIIFVDIDDEGDGNSQKKATLSHITNSITIKNSEIARLDAIDALVDHCYNGPAVLKSNGDVDIFGRLHLKNIGAIVAQCKRSYFYFLDNDEAKNIAGALNLQRDKRLCNMGNNRPTIYIHARREAHNEIFDHYSQYDGEARRMKIKIVDSAYQAIAKLKQDDGALPVNCVAVDSSTGLVNSPFTALVIGFGGTGQEAFKFLYEYSAFVGSDSRRTPFKCYAIDAKMSTIAGLVRQEMPAIGDDELKLIEASVDSEEFWDTIRGIITDVNYVVIALNNDSMELSLGVNLFKYALGNRPVGCPPLKIMVRCYNSSNEKRMTEVTSNLNRSVKGGNVEIRLYGLEKDLYCCDTILSDTILEEAKEYNKIYKNSSISADEQWKLDFGESEIKRLISEKGMLRYHAIFDINRRKAQNISNSLHRRTKIKLMGIDGNDAIERLKHLYDCAESRAEGTTAYRCGGAEANLLLNIARVEHERWIASLKLLGYTFATSNNNIQKHHKYLCPWDELDEVTQSYDCNVVDTTIRMEWANNKQ